jgi:hypothetical protein
MFRIAPYRIALSSYSVSCQTLYWNHFHTPLVLGFRSYFVFSNPIYTNFYFSKANRFMQATLKKFYVRTLLFGFFDDYLELKSLVNRTTDDFIRFYKLFLKTYNVFYRGFFWRGGALTNFRKFRRNSQYYFTLPQRFRKYKYYPTLAFSTHYSYSTFSLGFESMCGKIPLITPIDATVDPSIFSFPIPINSSVQNIYFFIYFYFSSFFKGFLTRFLTIKYLLEKKIFSSKISSAWQVVVKRFSRRRNYALRRMKRLRSRITRRKLISNFKIVTLATRIRSSSSSGGKWN